MAKNPTQALSETKSGTQSTDRGDSTGLSRVEMEILNYLFAKIDLTWGAALVAREFGNKATVDALKLDWARDLLDALKCGRDSLDSDRDYADRARRKIDTIFSELRQFVDNQRSWEFPSLKRICGYMANRVGVPEHRPVSDSRALPRKEADPEIALAWRTYIKWAHGWTLPGEIGMDTDRMLEIVNREAAKYDQPDAVEPEHKIAEYWR